MEKVRKATKRANKQNYHIMEINKPNKYFAFISYKREDEEWAIWFQHELENYHLPVTLNGRDGLPNRFRPVFRDIDELKAGNLPEQIYNALSTSTYLIVICSPNSAKSKWVNKEITDFIEIGRSKGVDNVQNIFPFIVEGVPYAKNDAEECFPNALKELPDSQERIGGNVNDSGRDRAFIKVMAGMMPNVAFDELWNRYERDKAEDERLKREERERFMCMQSRFMAEKIIDISHNSVLAQCLALEVLPKDLENPERPYTVEAEHALRQAAFHHNLFLRGHTLGIDDLIFSNDGKHIATISSDFTLRLWDAGTGTLIRTIKYEQPFGKSIVFSPDDTIIIAAFQNGTLNAWDTETGEELWQIDLKSVLDSDKEILPCSMALSPNGVLLAISSSDGNLYIINLADGATMTENVPAESLEFSRDGRYLLAVSSEGFVIWDFENGADARKEFDEEAKKYIESVFATFSPDNRQWAIIASTPLSSKVMIYDIEAGSQFQTIDIKHKESEDPGIRVGVTVSAAFANHGKDIITISNDGEIVVRNIETRKIVGFDFVASVRVNEAAFSSANEYIGMVVNQNDIIVRSLKSSYIERKIVTEEGENIHAISYSPDGKNILVGSGAYEKGRLAIWDVESGQMVLELVGHRDCVNSVAYSPNGEYIVSASHDGTMRVWNPKTGKNIRTLETISVFKEQAIFTFVSFSPDGTQIVAATQIGYIILWDIENGKIYSKFKDTFSPVFSVALSRDGNKIVSATLDRHLHLWDIRSGTMLTSSIGHTNLISFVVYSPNGNHILSASYDKTIICWDAQNGSIIWQISGFSGNIQSLDYSCDGKYLVVAVWDEDNPVVVYDAQNGKKVLTLKESMAAANYAVFSPDGGKIASAGADGTIRIWNFPPLQELIDQTRNRLKDRSLTKEERMQYYLE